MSEILGILPEALGDLEALGTAEDIKDKMSFYAKAAGTSKKETDSLRPYEVDSEGQLTIPIEGVLVPGIDFTMGGFLTGYDYINNTVEKASADQNVKSIKVAMNSPGGYMSGLFETTGLMAELASSKPVHTEIAGVGASAAYAIASTTNKIHAAPSSVVGSIGVIMNHVSEAKALGKAGIKVTTFKSGKLKDLGATHRPLTDEEKTIFQGKTDKLAEDFFALVEEGRGIKARTIKGFEAAVFDGVEAVDKGLVDSVSQPRTLSKGQTEMSDLKAEASIEVDVEEIASTAKAEGVKVEQERASAILAHPKSKANIDTALKLIETGVSIEQATAILDTLAEAKTEIKTGTPKANSSFDEAMANGNPEISNTSDEEVAELDDADEILAAMNLQKGE